MARGLRLMKKTWVPLKDLEMSRGQGEEHKGGKNIGQKACVWRQPTGLESRRGWTFKSRSWESRGDPPRVD